MSNRKTNVNKKRSSLPLGLGETCHTSSAGLEKPRRASVPVPVGSENRQTTCPTTVFIPKPHRMLLQQFGEFQRAWPVKRVNLWGKKNLSGNHRSTDQSIRSATPIPDIPRVIDRIVSESSLDIYISGSSPWIHWFTLEEICIQVNFQKLPSLQSPNDQENNNENNNNHITTCYPITKGAFLLQSISETAKPIVLHVQTVSGLNYVVESLLVCESIEQRELILGNPQSYMIFVGTETPRGQRAIDNATAKTLSAKPTLTENLPSTSVTPTSSVVPTISVTPISSIVPTTPVTPISSIVPTISVEPTIERYTENDWMQDENWDFV